MTGYDLVLGIWCVALVLAVAAAGWHAHRWLQVRAFRYFLRHGSTPADLTTDTTLGIWVQNALFHLGLRILLVVLAFERLVLQLTTPLVDRGDFAASPLQLGLALIFLLLLVWTWRWTLASHRVYGEVQGYLWAEPH